MPVATPRSWSPRASRAVRWSVPVTVAGLVAVAAVWGDRAASAEPSLPALSARDLIVKAERADVRTLSGTVRVTAELGFPALPTGGSGEWMSLLSGTHTVRVFVDGPRRQRVDLLGNLTQASVIRSDQDLWAWSSARRTVTHTRRATEGAPGSLAELTRSLDKLAPQQLADQALAALAPSTTVEVGRSARVAGRPAYVLWLQPQHPASTIGSVQLSVDADTGLALRVVITPRGSSQAALDVGYTALDLRAPSSDTFAFRPPPGATVEQLSPSPAPAPDRASPTVADDRPQVIGSGWTSVLRVRLPDRPTAASDPPEDASGTAPAAGGIDTDTVLRAWESAARPVSGRFGDGNLLRTRLFTVLRTADGQVFVGAVTSAALLRQADQQAGRQARQTSAGRSSPVRPG
ncbi:MAG: LolA family protein [Angustibacter sp.]